MAPILTLNYKAKQQKRTSSHRVREAEGERAVADKRYHLRYRKKKALPFTEGNWEAETSKGQM